MNLSNIDKEFELLKEYMDIYIQLLPNIFGGRKINKSFLPTFDEFKQTYSDERYSLVAPTFKEAKTIYDKDKISPVHTMGLGSEDGIAYRYYSSFMGIKYFTGGNINGDYIVLTEKINENLKKLI
jgi:hypothetical protein